MNSISSGKIEKFSQDFVPTEYLADKTNPYFIRNRQHDTTRYRKLTSKEIEILVKNNNSAENWDKIFVTKNFTPTLVRNCEFWGLVRMGDLTPGYLEYHKLRLPIGLHNSTIISCDLGDNVVVRNVRYLSHFIIGNHCILFNLDEMITVDNAKFGNGIVKEGETEEVRIWIELANENGNRAVLPFAGMLPADAYLWSRNRADKSLQQRFIELTDKSGDTRRGFYGLVGDHCVIKNSRIIKNVNFGSHCYVKGANKLKNLTIQSSTEEPTQIGEGVELVNGIIGYGNRIFYGVKAVRFVTGRNVQLKYGARLLNSFLGDNSTISCCEVLNNLIFPFHEQHHNNSFLIASTVQGQANIAAGATIGSNHNSRAPDGEIIAKRGFWPGLCSNFKHNSIFAPFALIAKGTYYAELNIRLPFTLISPGDKTDEINLYPGYWFKHNMYALARNSWKFKNRDKRIIKEQHIETDYLAPDTVESMFEGTEILLQAIQKAANKKLSVGEIIQNQSELDAGLKVVLNDALYHGKALIIKPAQGIALYRMMIEFYGGRALFEFLDKSFTENSENLSAALKRLRSSLEHPINEWDNLGGQIIPKQEIRRLIEDIKSGQLKSWEDIHARYDECWERYPKQKFSHAVHSLLRLYGLQAEAMDSSFVRDILSKVKATSKFLLDGAFKSREKDYTNPFRQATYENREEMEAVLGTTDSNSFLIDFRNEMTKMQNKIDEILSQF
ncbi:MAG: DUF4954 family protein [Calditrichaeota bacterium]|nr:DUF4954 family protein [Calditrichota bacterium]